MMITTPLANPLPKRLLIVDDHPDLATTLARTVAQVCPGLEVLTSRSGRDALEQIEDLQLDVLITDLMMPEMNGLELIEALQSRPIGGPGFIVLITAYEMEGLEDNAKRLNINATVLKPFPPGLLIQIVRRALEESSPRIELKQPEPHLQ